MVDTNYVGSIAKVLETPIQQVVNKQILMTQFRVQLPQIKKNRIIKLVFWGNLARNVVNHYQANDYIIIEGYLSFRDKINEKTKLNKQPLKKPQITVSRIYPFRLNLKK